MTLRKKTLLIVGLTLGVLFTGLLTAAWTIVLNSFKSQEREDTRINVERVIGALEDDLDQLGVTTRDWAEWDDTYEYMVDRNPDYLKSNWVDDTFPLLGLNFAIYADTEGQIVFSKAYDLNTEEVIPIPQELLLHLAPDGPLNSPSSEDGVVGLLSLRGGPILVASRPILTSEGEGPPRGHVIFGQFFDSESVEQLSRTTLLSLDSFPIDRAQTLPEAQDVIAGLTTEAPIAVQPLSSKVVAGYAVLPDLYGEPAVILKAVMARGVYQRGLATVLYFTGAVLVLGLVFGILIMGLLEKLVLARLSRLAHEVNSIGRTADFSSRVSDHGDDELSELGKEINGMLSSLEGSQEELRRSEQELREAQENLVQAEKLSAIGRLVAGVAHELNNPLTAVLGYSQLLSRSNLSPKAMEQLERVQIGAERSRRIVQNLLTFAGRRELRLGEVDLNSEVRQALQLLDIELRESHIQVELDLAPDLPPIEGDSSQLRSVFTNLVHNALSAMSHQQGKRTLLIRTTGVGGHVRISVVDNGPGIEPEQRSKIFDPFFTTKAVGAGTGLGLSLCYGIISEHNGRIWAESELGKGTSFEIELPMAVSQVPAREVSESLSVG